MGEPLVIDTLPDSGHNFLGRLHRDSEPISKTFDIPDFADRVTIEFNLYEIDDWTKVCDETKKGQNRRELAAETIEKNKVTFCSKQVDKKHPFKTQCIPKSELVAGVKGAHDLSPGDQIPNSGGKLWVNQDCEVVKSVADSRKR